MAMQYNSSPINIRQGHVYLDGVEIYDGVSVNAKLTPDVWTGQQLGSEGYDSRWVGWKITGDITRRRATPWLAEKIQEFKEKHATPEITIQGVMDDQGSDYYAENGTETVTLVGCVLTGDLTLLALDAAGDVLEDSISFNAKDFIR